MLRNTLLQATQAAANTAKEFFNNPDLLVSFKAGVNNWVTEADKTAEKAIIEVIQKQFPNHSILGEEGGAITMDSEYKWIIDPIDGTKNYASGVPICAVSIGIEKNGALIMGSVYNPFMNEWYVAEVGCGAILNDKKIAVSTKENFRTSCLAGSFGQREPSNGYDSLAVFNKFIRSNITIRSIGSSALNLCWVAAGRYDGMYDQRLNAWDSAAGVVIVREAGGMVSNFAGQAYNVYETGCIASNGFIHQQLVHAVQGKEYE